MRATLLAVLIAGSATMMGGNVNAGEFFEKDGVALRGYDPVAYFTENRPVKGEAVYQARYQGSVFHFATEANRDRFVANPSAYAPQYDGFCAFGTARGYKAATDPAAFTIVGGKLYLNYNASVQSQWNADRAAFIAAADEKWPEVETQTNVAD